MKPIHIQFEKLEFGTRFYDPTTKDFYRKVSETEAEPEDDHRYNRRILLGEYLFDSFHPNETVIVE